MGRAERTQEHQAGNSQLHPHLRTPATSIREARPPQTRAPEEAGYNILESACRRRPGSSPRASMTRSAGGLGNLSSPRGLSALSRRARSASEEVPLRVAVATEVMVATEATEVPVVMPRTPGLPEPAAALPMTPEVLATSALEAPAVMVPLCVGSVAKEELGHGETSPVSSDANAPTRVVGVRARRVGGERERTRQEGCEAQPSELLSGTALVVGRDHLSPRIGRSSRPHPRLRRFRTLRNGCFGLRRGRFQLRARKGRARSAGPVPRPAKSASAARVRT